MIEIIIGWVLVLFAEIVFFKTDLQIYRYEQAAMLINEFRALGRDDLDFDYVLKYLE